jgi:ring-1,2-phenylacetyl-CoA epoxidase subunit PaaD
VPDPEVPVLSVCDLGIVREVLAGTAVEVVLTPTYSGCPATEVIAQSVHDALAAAGFAPVTISTRRAPAWTTDWISADGRRKLRDYGIAPPSGDAPVHDARAADPHPRPQRRLPALRQRADRDAVGLRVHRLQGPVPLPGLPRAL